MIICQAATQESRTLITYLDECDENPRREWDNFGKMICWHHRYDLGDKHDYDSQHDFLRDVLAEMDNGRQLFQMLVKNRFFGARLTYDQKEDEWFLESYCNFSKKWTVEKTYTSSLTECNLPTCFLDDVLELLTETEMCDILNNHCDFVILPLYLIDHSGITMRVSEFSCPWDSGQVGWIYANHDMIRKEFGAVNADTIEQARNLLTSEVKTYDLFLTGQCYGYQCYEGETRVDGCGGYLGEYKDFVRDFLSELPYEFTKLVCELSDCLEPDVANYFWNRKHAS